MIADYVLTEIPAPDYSNTVFGPLKYTWDYKFCNMNEETEKESIKVLYECVATQIKKSKDYQNPNSRIRQADYYVNGVSTIIDIIHAKILRARSVIEAMENDPSYEPNFESVEDSLCDCINYLSFAVAYTRGKIDGQNPNHDFLNRPKTVSHIYTA